MCRFYNNSSKREEFYVNINTFGMSTYDVGMYISQIPLIDFGSVVKVSFIIMHVKIYL